MRTMIAEAIAQEAINDAQDRLETLCESLASAIEQGNQTRAADIARDMAHESGTLKRGKQPVRLLVTVLHDYDD